MVAGNHATSTFTRQRSNPLVDGKKVLLCECGHPLANQLIGSEGKPTVGCRFCNCEAARYKDS